MIFEQLTYRGWHNCWRMSNGMVELIAVADIGPRIIHFGFAEGPNVFAVLDVDAGQCGGEALRLYGGHRLWVAPEEEEITYEPDNSSVMVSVEGNTLKLVRPPSEKVQIGKEMEITMLEGLPQVRVVHRLINAGEQMKEVAPWALSVMAVGSEAFVRRGSSVKVAGLFFPDTSIRLWPSSHLQDSRLSSDKQYVKVRQDPDITDSFKIGIHTDIGWVGNVIGDTYFIKHYEYDPLAVYPDLNSNVQIYTDDRFLELETVGVWTRLALNEQVEHVELWELRQHCPDDDYASLL